MSAQSIMVCRATERCLALTVQRISNAEPSNEPDRYVPPAEEHGVIAFLTSAQSLLMLEAGLLAVTLLGWQLWSGRQNKRREDDS
ncbi:hypothetical protein [Streptomyces shenzhenensis]|uniref:hypothetical protein n=1 Tax=Streptomyces shenzhenensis TaxID=943815 RepID=UPI0036BB755F